MSKSTPIDFELARALSASSTNFYFQNVGNPIILLTLIEAPRPKDRVNFFPSLSTYRVLYVTTSVNLPVNFSTSDVGTAQSNAIGQKGLESTNC